MTDKECQIIRDLLPIYADGEVGGATGEFVEQHLKQCAGCLELLEVYQEPIFPAAADTENTFTKKTGFAGRFRRVAALAVVILLFAATAIAWASYNAGKNLALRDPSFQQAQKMDLFTEVNKSKNLGPYVVTVNRVLLDTARTTVFYQVDPAMKGEGFLEVSMTDDKGVNYQPRGGRGLHSKNFVYDLEPVNLNAENITLTFNTKSMPVEARFTIPVDPTLVAQNTRELYPNLTTQTGPVELSIDRAVLGLSESIFFFRARWSLEPEIAGVGVGTAPPMYTEMGPNGPNSAATRISRPLPAPGIKGANTGMPGPWARMVDITNGKKVKLRETRISTDIITGGIDGAFHFNAVDPSVRDLELTSPILYIYRFPAQEQVMEMEIPREGEMKVNNLFKWGPLSYTLEKVALEDEKLAFYLKYSDTGDKPSDYYRPDFRLRAGKFWRKGPVLEHQDGSRVKVTFHSLPDTEETALKLRSVGEKLERVKFKIPAAGN
ncbi:MAG: DUF4179 domain-containing protein [Firmicutes bacterium]|nr:DUF4179 domain-containing protein [Bacillota bacterium]